MPFLLVSECRVNDNKRLCYLLGTSTVLAQKWIQRHTLDKSAAFEQISTLCSDHLAWNSFFFLFFLPSNDSGLEIEGHLETRHCILLLILLFPKRAVTLQPPTVFLRESTQFGKICESCLRRPTERGVRLLGRLSKRECISEFDRERERREGWELLVVRSGIMWLTVDATGVCNVAV